jgi:hypothetical protein
MNSRGLAGIAWQASWSLEQYTTSGSEVFAQFPCPMSEPNDRLALWPLTVVILFSCVVNWPCLLWGLQFGHDHNLHITYLHFFDAQLRAGELYPHWISGLNFGAGSPIFFVQYPLPFYAAAGLRWAFHISATPVGYAHALGLFVFLTGICSGMFTWLWCRSLANPWAAVLASMACLTMPYIYSCDVYYRGAIGEYSALAWVPLALFFAHRTDASPVRAVAGIASAFAMIVLSHLFTALLFAPFLILYGVFRVNRARVRVTVLIVGCALLLGLGLSAVYFLPLNVHRSLFSMANLIRFGSNNFFYGTHLFPFDGFPSTDSRLRLRLVGLLSAALGCLSVGVLIVRRQTAGSLGSRVVLGGAVICVVLTCAPLLLRSTSSVPQSEAANVNVIDVRSRIFIATLLTLDAALLAFGCLRNYAERLPQFLLAASLLCYFLTTRWSEWVWRDAPLLWNIQFPWRFTGLLSIFTAGLIAFALRDLWVSPHRRRLLIMCAAFWLSVVVAGCVSLDLDKDFAPPFFTEFRSRVETPFFAYANISREPTLDDLGPNDGLTSGVSFVAGDGTASLNTITARHLHLTVDCLRPCTLLLKLVYYPFWRAYEGPGISIPLRPSNRAGLTELSLTPGIHEVNLELPVGRSEVWGAWLSLSSLGITLILCCLSSARFGKRCSNCFSNDHT